MVLLNLIRLRIIKGIKFVEPNTTTAQGQLLKVLVENQCSETVIHSDLLGSRGGFDILLQGKVSRCGFYVRPSN